MLTASGDANCNKNRGLAMAKEKSWGPVMIPIVTASNAKLTVTSTVGLYTKQKITLSKLDQPTKNFQITSVLDANTITVSDPDKSLGATADVTAYANGVLFAPLQARNTISNAPIIRNSYAEEPISALKTIEVGPSGDPMTTPKGQIGSVDPDTHFSYGSSCEVLRIEEAEQSSAKRYSGTIDTNTSGYIQLGGVYQHWMKDSSGIKQFALFETDLLTGEAVTVTEYTITGHNPYNSDHFVAPNSNRIISFTTGTNQIDITGTGITLPEWIKPGLRFRIIGGINNTSGTEFLTVQTLIDANTFDTVEGLLTESAAASTLDARVSILDVMPAPAVTLTYNPIVNPAIIDGALGDKSKVSVFEYGAALEITDIYTENDTLSITDLIQGLRKKPL